MRQLPYGERVALPHGGVPQHDTCAAGIPLEQQVRRLRKFIEAHRRLLVLTGAGCSTDSGIPDYRTPHGSFRKRQPMQFGVFKKNRAARQRYWARGFVGWPKLRAARPNAAHYALSWLEDFGCLHHLVTQNVDGLHRAAGSRRMTELHGTMDTVRCLQCSFSTSRDDFQQTLMDWNPSWQSDVVDFAPDGDADIEGARLSGFRVPDCPHCGGILKPDVVFFGEPVPTGRARFATERLEEADALLVVGSSLTVWSGYRFAKHARDASLPLAILNLGPTRADSLATLRIWAGCAEVLANL